jgi:hypothetical protein
MLSLAKKYVVWLHLKWERNFCWLFGLWMDWKKNHPYFILTPDLVRSIIYSCEIATLDVLFASTTLRPGGTDIFAYLWAFRKCREARNFDFSRTLSRLFNPSCSACCRIHRIFLYILFAAGTDGSNFENAPQKEKERAHVTNIVANILWAITDNLQIFHITRDDNKSWYISNYISIFPCP